MACTKPIQAWKYGVTKNGKQRYVFKRPEGISDDYMQEIPCQKCLSCKLSYAKEWALRIYHENSFQEHSSFITLTYNEENIPHDRSVHRSEVVTFNKNLRHWIDKNLPGTKIKTFYCGEYGDKKGRPHYHIIILGFDFPDKEYLMSSDAGNTLYSSKILDSLWTNEVKQSKGFANIGEVTYESAGYVARYCLKKQTKGNKKEYTFVEGYDEKTGEIYKIGQKEPEFIGMSKGIGKKWHEAFKHDTDKDYITTNGYKHKVPRYYDKIREKEDPESLRKIKEQREIKAKENTDNTKTRLVAKDIVKQHQNSMLKRGYESD